VTKDDILRLLEIKMQRILKFNKDKADELMARIQAEIEEIDRDLANLVEVTAQWFQFLKDKYGKDYPRLTEIRNFDTIEATKVVEANQKLYINRQDGFIGTGLKKDEFVCNCSDIDDIIIFYRDGKFRVVRVVDKLFVGKNILWLGVFKKNDQRTIYNVVYRDGRKGFYYIKRFNVSAVTRDREYDVTMGTEGSRVLYFTANPNGEAEVIKVTLDPAPKLKRIFFDKDFSEVLIKGRSAKGNLLTKYQIHRIGLKSHGRSTLGGRKVWYDPDVNRLNYDEHGRLLGEFNDGDQILVILKNGDYYLTGYDANVHFEDNISMLEKYDANKVWSCVLFDADNQGYPYVKRFLMEASKRKQNYLGDNENSLQVLLTDTPYPRLQVVYGGADAFRGSEEVDVEQFIAVKGFKAKGKRLTTWQTESITELEPTRFPEEPQDADNDEGDGEEENLDPDAGKSQQQVMDELTGQLSLFPDEV
jgi:topoisomerase-4 subunit A